MSTPTAAHGALPEAGELETFDAWYEQWRVSTWWKRGQPVPDHWNTSAKHDRREGWMARAALSPASPARQLTRGEVDALVYRCRQQGDDSTYALVNAALAFPASPAPAAPSGWKLVPIEPTAEMETAAENDYEQRGETFPDWKSKWRAMLAATPAQQTQSDAVAGAEFVDIELRGLSPEAVARLTALGNDGVCALLQAHLDSLAATPPQQATPPKWHELAMLICRDVAELDHAPTDEGQLILSPEDLALIVTRHLDAYEANQYAETSQQADAESCEHFEECQRHGSYEDQLNNAMGGTPWAACLHGVKKVAAASIKPDVQWTLSDDRISSIAAEGDSVALGEMGQLMQQCVAAKTNGEALVQVMTYRKNTREQAIRAALKEAPGGGT